MPQQTGPGPANSSLPAPGAAQTDLLCNCPLIVAVSFENPRKTGRLTRSGQGRQRSRGYFNAWREPVQPGDGRSRGRCRRHGFTHHRCPRGAVLRRACRRSRGAHPHRPGRPHRRPRRGADLRELGAEVDVLDPARWRTLVALAPHPVRELPRPGRGQARRRRTRQVARRCRRRRRARAVHGRPQRPADLLHRPEEGRDRARPLDRDHVRLHQGPLQLPLQGGQGRLPHLHLAVRRGQPGRGSAPAQRRRRPTAPATSTPRRPRAPSSSTRQRPPAPCSATTSRPATCPAGR